MTTLQEFYDKLERADWFYEMSDDHSVWHRGSAEFGGLEAISKESPEHKALYDGFHKHYYSGKPWNTEKVSKPERPAA